MSPGIPARRPAGPGRRLELTVPCQARQLRAVRAFVATCLAPSPDAGTPVLLASELAANSAVHSHTSPGALMTITLTSLAPGTVRIEVTDPGRSSVPQVRARTDALTVAGRGLDLVDALSERWGYRTEPDGSLVTWCDVAGVLARGTGRSAGTERGNA